MRAPEMRESGSGSGEQALVRWPWRVKLLTNRNLLPTVVRASGAAAGVVAVIFALASGEWQTGLLMGAGGFAFLLAVYLLTGIVVDLAGGFRVTFSLTNRGVRSSRGDQGKAVPAIAGIGGMLAGNLAAVGAGLGADAERNVFIAYEDVRKVKVSASRRYILVRGGFGEKPIGLYCREEDAGKIVEILRERCPSAKFV